MIQLEQNGKKSGIQTAYIEHKPETTGVQTFLLVMKQEKD